ncbi:hypothetical protein RchiOBHm_Chr5g0072111 [Rosa chinensis]|uniref:Uncharacterized protein n=1 Tax=Rosa chinensis TaxID=74649 RepID=A0A2P6QKK1_ROSCH|nr:hypothetical protein RchiOBHm_Chr5g0072111 [Rosa chinensis]
MREFSFLCRLEDESELWLWRAEEWVWSKINMRIDLLLLLFFFFCLLGQKKNSLGTTRS